MLLRGWGPFKGASPANQPPGAGSCLTAGTCCGTCWGFGCWLPSAPHHHQWSPPHMHTHAHASSKKALYVYTLAQKLNVSCLPSHAGIVPIVVLGIGSTSPGLLSYFIDKFSLVFPDYKDRVIRHGEGAVPLPWAPCLCRGPKKMPCWGWTSGPGHGTAARPHTRPWWVHEPRSPCPTHLTAHSPQPTRTHGTPQPRRGCALPAWLLGGLPRHQLQHRVGARAHRVH